MNCRIMTILTCPIIFFFLLPLFLLFLSCNFQIVIIPFVLSSLRMFDYEDVTVGAWMLAMNVKHEDNRAMCDPTCTPSSIAVWDKKCSGISA